MAGRRGFGVLALAVILGMGRMAAAEPAAEADIVGDYRQGDGTTIAIRSQEGKFLYINPKGRRSRLERVEKDVYRDDKVEQHFVRDASGRITHIIVATPKGESRWNRVELPYAIEEVQVQDGAATLSGTLLTPLGRKEACPAVILLWGAGNWERDPCYQSLATAFAEKGIAVLTDDRARGEEKIWPSIAQRESYVSHAKAWRRFLKGRARIDPSRIGYWGLSYGSRVAARAASRDPEAAFLVAVSAMTLSRAEDIREIFLRNLVSGGLTHEQAQEAYRDYTGICEAYYPVKGPEEPPMPEAYQVLKVQLDKQAWWASCGFSMFLSGALEPADEFLRLQRGQLVPPRDEDDNLREVYEKIGCPVLAIWGEKDGLVIPEPNRSVLEAGLKAAKNRDVTVRMFPGADHLILLEQGGLAPGYLDAMIDWILHVKPRGGLK